MFSLDTFYNFINYHYNSQQQQIQLHIFQKPGSRELKDFLRYGDADNSLPPRFISQTAMFGSEPVEPEYFAHWVKYNTDILPDIWKNLYKDEHYYKTLSANDFIFRHLSGAHCPIICHSEINSNDVRMFEDHYFSPVYYFHWGLISRDWFRHWKNYNITPVNTAKRLGLYARDGSGSRQYRVDLITKLTPFKNQIHYFLQPEISALLDPDIRSAWPENKKYLGPESSAIIDLNDCKKFQIQIVPETIFNTTKTHLTEKIFKPMVMRQPFIVVGPPNSLCFLQKYGFKTFGDLWDESYDLELLPEKRMNKIISLVSDILSLSKNKFNQLMEKTKQITEHNHSRFFSHEFEDRMLEELFKNLNNAIAHQKERFYDMPGGTWFYYQDKIYQKNKCILEPNRSINQQMISYMIKNNYANVAKQIISKYRHLL